MSTTEYDVLVQIRKQCNDCLKDNFVLTKKKKICKNCQNNGIQRIRLRNPGEISPSINEEVPYNLAIFDCDEIGAWSTWQGCKKPTILVVGQDWGNVSYYLEHKGKDNPKSPTNVNLRRFMAYILDKQETEFPLPKQAYENRELSQKFGIFFTNAILCLKEAYCERISASGEKQITSCINEMDVTGGQQLDVNGQWFHNCGSHFLNPLIDFLNPRIIVTMGNYALRTALASDQVVIDSEDYEFFMESKPFQSMKKYYDKYQSGVELKNGGRLFLVWHCGSNSNCNRNKFNKTNNIEEELGLVWDWKRVKDYYKELKSNDLVN